MTWRRVEGNSDWTVKLGPGDMTDISYHATREGISTILEAYHGS